ncbi:MAG: leucine-rich repeat protein, partial [Clostridiales bacterium]|nr:leucine-rich repeat protein [Clostridiales bacterium]
IFYIGSNAFKNAGSAMSDDDWFFCAVPEDVKAIGESAFENVPMTDIYLPENVYKIKSRAFANTKLTSVTFYSNPAEIADDAFEGVTADAFTVSGMWEDGDKSSFGGELTYSTLYKFEYEEDYGTDEMSGSGYMYVPENITFEYEFFDSDEYVFDRFEIIEGSLDVTDFKNPVISSKINGNVRLKVYYTPVSDRGGNRDDDPITDPASPTMFSAATVIIVIAIWFAVSAVASALIVIFVICRKDGKDKTENKN